MQTRWHIVDNAEDWLAAALDTIRAAATNAIAARGEFHIVLAGGSTPERVYRALAREAMDWSHWRIWFGDERCLPADHPERNSVMAERAWLAPAKVPAHVIHLIPAERGALTAARAYTEALAGVDDFDLVLLGLGEDGHTASLFPGQDWGETRDAPAALPVFSAPKPPPERVSLSAWRLSCARQVHFWALGAGKREAVAAWRRGESLPAAAIRPNAGVDVWIDRAALGE